MRKGDRILPLEEAYLADVAELERLSFAEPWSEQSLRLLLGENGLGVVVVRDGNAVAYGGMTVVLDEGSVTNIAVHPHARRAGLGRAVVRALMERARSRGIVSVFLEVRESNEAALSLYRSEGFVPCGIRKNFYRYPTESAIQMVYHQPSLAEE
ncbi:MAG: ribosomal protein S18-alanine N-acetyltransferase [Clostridia bacterium]|nr:ribosomal protein S18-alanine N-acetyltransferase [Clostridia bacterium]